MDIVAKGRKGELAFNSWLCKHEMSYLYIEQSKVTFSSLFPNNLKRPDFLVLLESIGMIAIDVKNKKFSGGVYTLNMEDEFQKALTFERVFRLPVWYVFRGEENNKETWYWISALKAIEVGERRFEESNNKEFIAIKLEHFEQVNTIHDLGKLYTHRLPKLVNISKVPIEFENKMSNLNVDLLNESKHSNIYYDSSRVNSIFDKLDRHIEFDISYENGMDGFFSTKTRNMDLSVSASIDAMSSFLLRKINEYSNHLTIQSENLNHPELVNDHLIYAVNNVTINDLSDKQYKIYIDAKKLTSEANQLIEVLQHFNDCSVQFCINQKDIRFAILG